MSLAKRIGWYLAGVSIGIVFLTFFLKQKDTEFCYLPNCRVLKNIRTKKLTLTDGLTNIPDSTTVNYMLKKGNVNFKQSETKTEPCKTYVIEIDNKILTIENCPEKANIKDFSIK